MSASSIFPEGKVCMSQPLGARLSNLGWERRLGISTRGSVPVDYPDAHHYAAMQYSSILEVLRFLSLSPADTFVDIGSGKGRVICCAARHRVAKVVGIDLSAEFCEQATANARRMRGRKAPIEVHNVIAQDFDYSEGSVYYLFDPFGPDTLGQVLDRIHKDRGEKPVRIAYTNPTHKAAFADQLWLDEYEFWDKAARSSEHSVAFYRTKAGV
jgi:SAM-dependent methyltransferase